MIHRPLRCKQWVLSRAWDVWLETWVPVLIQQQRSAESSDWRWKLLPHVLTSPQQKFSRGNMVSPRHGVPHTYTLSTQETEAGGLPKVWGYSGIGSEYNAIQGYIWRDYMKKIKNNKRRKSLCLGKQWFLWPGRVKDSSGGSHSRRSQTTGSENYERSMRYDWRWLKMPNWKLFSSSKRQKEKTKTKQNPTQHGLVRAETVKQKGQC